MLIIFIEEIFFICSHAFGYKKIHNWIEGPALHRKYIFFADYGEIEATNVVQIYNFFL